jgi:hypothetical protein
MKNIYRIVHVAVIITVALFLATAAFAAKGKDFKPDPKGIELPDLDKDPGFYFLLAEQAEAGGHCIDLF